jgi:hypothetical protein
MIKECVANIEKELTSAESTAPISSLEDVDQLLVARQTRLAAQERRENSPDDMDDMDEPDQVLDSPLHSENDALTHHTDAIASSEDDEPIVAALPEPSTRKRRTRTSAPQSSASVTRRSKKQPPPIKKQPTKRTVCVCLYE